MIIKLKEILNRRQACRFCHNGIIDVENFNVKLYSASNLKFIICNECIIKLKQLLKMNNVKHNQLHTKDKIIFVRV